MTREIHGISRAFGITDQIPQILGSILTKCLLKVSSLTRVTSVKSIYAIDLNSHTDWDL